MSGINDGTPEGWEKAFEDLDRWREVMTRTVNEDEPLKYIREHYVEVDRLQDLVFLMGQAFKGLINKEAEKSNVDPEILLSMIYAFMKVELERAKKEIESGSMTGDEFIADLSRRLRQ